MEIPNSIQEIINGKQGGFRDNIGQSGAAVYILDDIVLKIQDNGDEADNEYRMMQWLGSKLPVPQIIKYEKTNKFSYLVMSKCSGKIACCDELMHQPKYLSEVLANALQEIWHVDSDGCPSNQSLNYKLQLAEYNVSCGRVDINNCESGTFGAGGFRNPEALLYWLKENKPNEISVLSHGDFCLPNILFNRGTLTGLIDLGRSGLADKWCDIALCYRSLKNNYSGQYTGRPMGGWNEEYFFDALQTKPDWDRIHYYILLDELF